MNIAKLNLQLKEANHDANIMSSRYQKSKKIVLDIDTNRAVHSELLTLHRRECSDSQCDSCGVTQRLKMGSTCIIDSNTEKSVSYLKYVLADTITKEGIVKLGTQKVLTKVTSKQNEFFDYFHDFLGDKYLPHRWVSTWDGFHRQLLFDALPYDTLLYHTDFSATYTCMGQDGGTCVQDKTAIQGVFVTSLTFTLPCGRRILINDSWHFWGPVDKFSCPSNNKFHNTCLQIIWAHYETLYPGRFKHLIGLSDGCAEQYKSQFAVYEMTFMCMLPQGSLNAAAMLVVTTRKRLCAVVK